MLPGKAEQRRTSSLFIHLAPLGRAPRAHNPPSAPKSPRRPGHGAPEAAGPDPTRPAASAARGGASGGLGEPPADICAFCHKGLCSWAPAVQAMNRQYHAECFACRLCHSALAGQRYFQEEGRPLCPTCYQNALEKCAKCQAAIWNQVVRALGSSYHPECFVCVECGQTIGEETFAVDQEGRVHCLGDFYRKFALVCGACEKSITPSGGRDNYRIECLGRSFHKDCYRCQSCRVRLSPEPTEEGCYPLNGSLFCKACHIQHKESSR